MNPFQRDPQAACAVVTMLLFTGCSQGADNSHAHESGEAEQTHEAVAGVTFNAKKGLRVPSTTAKFIGLQVADVEERRIAASFQFTAEVYRAASETQFSSLQPISAPAALASGNVSPVDAEKLSEGQSVSVRSGDGAVSLPGRIVAFERDLESVSGQVEVLLAVSDAQQSLASGTFISVTVSLGGERSAVSVPRSALLRTTEGDCVYAVNGDHFARTAVKLGLTDGEFTEVTDGLFVGDKVVVHPVMTLWMTELHNVNGGDACCIAPKPGK